MGTPSIKSRIERIVSLLKTKLKTQLELKSSAPERPPLNDYDMIALPTSDSRGETRTKRADQESKECP